MKNLGIRRPSPLLVGAVLPKDDVPPCCRGIEIWGFMNDRKCVKPATTELRHQIPLKAHRRSCPSHR